MYVSYSLFVGVFFNTHEFSDAALEEFIVKRALLDDHIRHLWVELGECQNKFIARKSSKSSII
jgi:hypothetical protein